MNHTILMVYEVEGIRQEFYANMKNTWLIFGLLGLFFSNVHSEEENKLGAIAIERIEKSDFVFTGTISETFLLGVSNGESLLSQEGVDKCVEKEMSYWLLKADIIDVKKVFKGRVESGANFPYLYFEYGKKYAEKVGLSVHIDKATYVDAFPDKSEVIFIVKRDARSGKNLLHFQNMDALILPLKYAKLVEEKIVATEENPEHK